MRSNIEPAQFTEIG